MKTYNFLRSFCLAALLLILSLPLSAGHNVRPIYLKVTDSNLLFESENFYAYFWSENDKSDAGNLKMNKLSDGLYSVDIVFGFNYIKFLRLSPDATQLDWNEVWNQTDDLQLSNLEDLYTITSKSSGKYIGSWSVYSESGGEQTDTKAIYLNPTDWWGNTQSFYAYAWKDKNNPKAIKMTKVFEYLYKADLDKDYTSVIFYRMSADETSFALDKTNERTNVLSLSDTKNVFTIILPTTTTYNDSSWTNESEYDEVMYAKYYDYGSCGTNVNYTLGRDGLLSITGNGEMKNYFTATEGCGGWVPWVAWNQIDTISLPEGLTKIGTYAFEECNVKNITIPSTVNSIGSGALYGGKLTSITCKATTPPSIDVVKKYKTEEPYHFCLGVDFSIPVYVPGSSIKTYKAAEQWKDFTNYMPIPGTEVSDDLYFSEPKTPQTVDCSIKTYSFDTQNSANGILTAYFETKNGAKIYLVYNTGSTNVTYIDGNSYSVTANSPQSFLAGYYSDGKPFNSYMDVNGIYYYITSGTINAANYAVGTELTVDVTSYYGTKIQFTSFISFYDPDHQTQYTITAKANNDAYGTVTGGGTYKEGTEVTLIATPTENYVFVEWNDGNTDNPRFITLSQDSTLIAKFAPKGGGEQTENHSISGQCGDNMSFTLDTISGQLDITGTGAIPNYPWWSQGPLWGCPPPWWYAEEGCYVAHPYYIATLNLPVGLTAIGSYAFAGCTKLTAITCLATTPPTLGSDVFKNIDTSIPIYVPAASINLYKAAEQWKDFTNIQAIGGGSEGGEGGTSGEGTTITIEDAIAAANALEDGATSDEVVTVEGYVIDAEDFDWSFKNQVFNISDTQSNSGQQILHAYRCRAIENGDTVPVLNGDKIRLTGKLSKFKQGEQIIPEISYGTAKFISKVDGDRSEHTVETISASKAVELASALAKGKTGSTIYNVVGYVTKIIDNSFDTDYKNMTFWIADAQGTAATNAEGAFYVYRGKPNVELVVGDKVSITTKLKNFNGTYESETNITVKRINPEDTGGQSGEGGEEQQQKYTITVKANNDRFGSVSGGGVYEKGKTATLTATEVKGTKFVKWSDGITNNPRSVYVSSNATYTAIFKVVPSQAGGVGGKSDDKSGVVDPWANEASPSPMATEETVNEQPAVRKLLIDGHIYIFRDGKVFTITGAAVK